MPEGVFSLQNAQGHGIDLICKVAPYPPPPKWLTIESKTVMRESFGQYATPMGGKVRKYQKKPIDNLEKHTMFAKNIPSEYSINADIRKMMKELSDDIDMHKSSILENNEKLIQGFKLTIEIDKKFNVANNSKFSEIYLF